MCVPDGSRGEKDSDNWLSACPEHCTNFLLSPVQSSFHMQFSFLSFSFCWCSLANSLTNFYTVSWCHTFSPGGLQRIQQPSPSTSSATFVRPGIKSDGATIQRSNQPFRQVRQPQMSPSTVFSFVNKPNTLVTGRKKKKNLLGSEHEIKQRGSFLLLVTGAFEIETVVGKDNEQCCANGGTLI